MQASKYCKKGILEAAKLAYANKTKEIFAIEHYLQ